MQNKIYFIFYVLILFLSNNGFSANLIDNKTFKEIAKVSEEIIENCPPRDCLILGIGRSPTPILAFLEASGNTNVSSIPLTGFRYNPFDETSLLPNEEDELFKHFDRFVKDNIDSKKKIVVVDFSVSGRSAFAATSYLKKYLKEKEHKIKVSPVIVSKESSIFNSSVGRTSKSYKVESFTHIELEKDSTLGGQMLRSKYDNLSPYGTYEAYGTYRPDPIKKKQYLDLVEKMKSKISKKKFIGAICLRRFFSK